ncbi:MULTISPECIES: Bug family tripartite tricarboxylate transporter substrate binding protein [Bradyrhizobium]|uniref:Tripartite tricarboxylate transporter substrate binding protein n=1 Tax=Bradyrhizobium arachidis TaxID=858423 RepID=A0AAE7THL0_9BRAD|nr:MULTISPECIES: tripartite tricarboxylate transporter substrate binding protein [Bradyrhizobium]QOG20281.1 tripartite tricarboxylate transporter substrate binding protein [Bradyrhizobium sp. SEMIA]QOZ67976.1 tripartite tricarboxylate transporter substrate binding protein [Bradyrhizobium arachidis]UFW52623.1 tripartite tricarboxylate transporter substrate binding protein [Bradyrhizobium arachidis]SFV09956.1 Tripartite-type tricarboxylate transporter, receptor component TctC [Bradyrhizobium arac
MAWFGRSKITNTAQQRSEGFHPDRRSLLSFGAGAALAAAGLRPAQAQDYPARPIQVLVPFAGGSASDVITRILLNRMSTSLGQAFVVDNRPGAGGNIGTAAAAHAAADGYTLLMSTSGPLAANKSLYKELPYDPQKDLAPIGLFATMPNVIVINSRLPPKSLRELIDYAKAHPRELNYGTVGVGSSQHLSAAYFEQLTGTEITHVPYRNIAAYTPDFIAGQVPLGFQLLPNVLGLIKSGDARPLAVASDKRMTALPDVPTAAEAGLKDYESAAWLALLAPANTDKAIVGKLYKAMVEAVNDPKVRALFVEQGAEPLVMDPQGLTNFMTAETTKWAGIIKKIGIEPM